MPRAEATADERITKLHTTLFGAILSAATDNDRRYMLVIQSAVALKRGHFTVFGNRL